VKADVLIVGAGFAGAATAYHLSRLSRLRILIIDKEPVPGYHASGRNASLLLQSVEHADVRATIASSRAAYQRELGRILSPTGSMLLGARARLEQVRAVDLIASEYCDPERVRSAIPLLSGHLFEAALYTPSDAVVDIAALLHFYLEGARERGATLWLNCRLLRVEQARPWRAQTSRGVVEADVLVDAAGAWAAEVANMAGATAPPLSPLKRHLFVLGEVAGIRPEWPYVWSLDRNFYFRPELGEVLFSVCDEQAVESLEPTVDPEIGGVLAELIWRELPALREAVQKRAWSCFRTKTPDGRFVIGAHPHQPTFCWAAGLGGHGMGASWEVGRLAAEAVLAPESGCAPAFSPARFAA
jgi:glycine/D-amino acid oxidase-like deaminating enzyme